VISTPPAPGGVAMDRKPRIAAATGAVLRIKIPDRQRAITPLVTLY